MTISQVHTKSVFMTPLFNSSGLAMAGGLHPSRECAFLARIEWKKTLLLRDGWLRHEQRSKGFPSSAFAQYSGDVSACIVSAWNRYRYQYGSGSMWSFILYIHLAMYFSNNELFANFVIISPDYYFPWPLRPPSTLFLIKRSSQLTDDDSIMHTNSEAIIRL